MGSSTWSDETTVTASPIVLTDEQKKEIIAYCQDPENEDVPYDITADHFTKKFGIPVTGPEIYDFHITTLIGNPK